MYRQSYQLSLDYFLDRITEIMQLFLPLLNIYMITFKTETVTKELTVPVTHDDYFLSSRLINHISWSWSVYFMVLHIYVCSVYYILTNVRYYSVQCV